MKAYAVNRRRLLSFIVPLLALALFVAIASSPLSVLRAQAQLDARQVAALVQSFYDQTQTIEAEFFQTRYTKLYRRYDRARGKVVFSKPGKMRWDYAQPNGQVFVSDGERLLIYQPPDEGERHGQLIERGIRDDQLPQAFAFLTGTGRIGEDFHFRLLDPGKQGFPGGHVLELRPRKPSPHYERVLFFVRIPRDARAGVIHRVLIVDAAGNRNRFDFSKLKFNRRFGASQFQFTPPAGTRVVRP